MNLTKEQRILSHKEFLAANWDRLSAFARENQQRAGRGVVVVPEEDCLHDEPRALTPRLSYAAKGSTLLNEISVHFEAQEWVWLDSYDPNDRVIVIVVRTDVGTSGYLIGSAKRPSEVYDQRKGVGI